MDMVHDESQPVQSELEQGGRMILLASERVRRLGPDATLVA